jgi:hypothetical protein
MSQALQQLSFFLNALLLSIKRGFGLVTRSTFNKAKQHRALRALDLATLGRSWWR